MLFSSSLIQTQEGISDRWNLTFMWTHSSVTRVAAQSKNKPKTNRTEQNPAKIKHMLRFTAAAPTSFSVFPFFSPFVPLLCIFFQSSCHSTLPASETLFKQKPMRTKKNKYLLIPGETCRWQFSPKILSSGGTTIMKKKTHETPRGRDVV